MSEKVRIRTSKWDLPEETNKPDEAKEENIHPESVGTEATDWSSPKSVEHTKINVDTGAYNSETRNQNNSESGAYDRETGNQHRSISLISETIESDDRDTTKMQNSRWSDMEDGKRDRPTGKVPGWHRTKKEHENDADGWGTASLSQSYRASVSPGRTQWKRHSHSISPKGRSNRPYRSRSPNWSRSRSRSRSFSQSRSPISGFRKEPDDWTNRARPLSGRSEVHCRAFVAGRCQRGTYCRYLHEDGDRRKSYRHDDSRESRYERNRTSVSGRKDYIEEPMERRDYVYDNTSHGQRNSYDEERRNHSTQQCYDFKMGRCQRGSACRYRHNESSYREQHGNDGYNERTYFREGGTSSGNDRSHDFRRLNATPCKFFAMGNCRNGNKCKFSHQSQVSGQNPVESYVNEPTQVWEYETQQSWNGTNHNDRDLNLTGENDHSQGFAPGPLNMQIKHAAYSQSSESWKAEQVKYPTSEMSPTTGFPVHIKPQTTLNLQQQFEPTIASEIGTKDVAILHPENKDKNMPQVDASTVNDNRWKNNVDLCTDNQSGGSLSDRQTICQTGFVQQPNKLSPVGQTQPTAPPVFGGASNQISSLSLSSTVQKQPASSQTLSSATVVETTGHAQVVIPPFYGGHSMQNIYSLPSVGPVQMPTLQPHLSVRGPIGNETVVPITGHGQSQYTYMQPNVNVQYPSGVSAHVATLQPKLNVQSANGHENFTLPAKGQSQSANIHPNVNLDANKQGLQLPFGGSNQCVTLQLNSVIQAPEGKDTGHPLSQPTQSWPNQEAKTLSSDTPELKNVECLPETSSGNKVVTTEQIAQLSNLSASLAQIFGNGQQLPQLYASLNPIDSSGMVPIAINQPSSLPPVSAVTSFQSHTNSLGDNSKPEMLNVKGSNPDGISSELGVPKNNIQNSLVPLQTAAPAQLLMEGQNNVGDSKNINLEGRFKNSIPELKVAGRNDSSETFPTKLNQLGERKKLEQDEQTKETAAGDLTDGDGKKSKDVKGTHMFKNALVEFVKDVLKPMWKEGNMSKEAHKTIVKKVIDKVTTAMQSNIPQTQDKVDLYLSHSKAKLTKLVQAYVEKYSKL